MTLYALSRLVDDAVDEASDPQAAQDQIKLWRQRIEFCYGESQAIPENLQHPLLTELKDTIQQFQMPLPYFLDLLEGMQMDLEKNRYPHFQDLEKYCYHVAGTVGLLCNCIFGVEGAGAKDYAIHLGTAFQLTNILRDVGQDAQKGRIYLPLEDLSHFGISEEDILAGRESKNFTQLMNFEMQRAESFFKQAEADLNKRLRKKILPAEIMSVFYRRILAKLENKNYPVFHEERVSLKKWEKLGLLGATLVQSIL